MNSDAPAPFARSRGVNTSHTGERYDMHEGSGPAARPVNSTEPQRHRSIGGLPPHAFVRSDDPNFGSVFGGSCAAVIDGTVCGWPEMAHLQRTDAQS